VWKGLLDYDRHMNATSVDTVVEPGSTPGKILSTYAIRACLFLIFLKKDPDSIKEQVFVYLSLMKSRHENQARKKRSSQLSSVLASCCDTRICSMLYSAQCYRNENINTERALRTCS
jgi:hypothetical protein